MVQTQDVRLVRVLDAGSFDRGHVLGGYAIPSADSLKDLNGAMRESNVPAVGSRSREVLFGLLIDKRDLQSKPACETSEAQARRPTADDHHVEANPHLSLQHQ